MEQLVLGSSLDGANNAPSARRGSEPADAAIGGIVMPVDGRGRANVDTGGGPNGRPRPATKTSRLRVLVVDDHPVVRAGLRALVELQDDLHFVGEAADAGEAVRLAERRAPDVVLMDVSMPGTNGVDAIAEIRHLRPGVRILMLSIHDEAEYVREAFAHGAMGYVLKEAAPTELVTAIHTVAAGGRYLHPTLGAKLIAPATDEPVVHDPLSARERQVLRLLARGHTNQEVSERLFVSVRTVEAHRSHILSKLRLGTRADLVRYAIHAGMLDGRE
jgi:two-component system response regulator NreC